MRSVAERLQAGVTVLEGLHQTRIETGDPRFGWDLEQSIIETELQELEQDSVLSEELVYVRRCHQR
jgi:hypothetical protein